MNCSFFFGDWARGERFAPPGRYLGFLPVLDQTEMRSSSEFNATFSTGFGDGPELSSNSGCGPGPLAYHDAASPTDAPGESDSEFRGCNGKAKLEVQALLVNVPDGLPWSRGSRRRRGVRAISGEF
jgi:hypothetical protein